MSFIFGARDTIVTTVLFMLGNVVPYVAAAVFVLGMAWRTWSWLSKPTPFPLALRPDRARPARQAAELARHLLLFQGLYRGERRLWRAAWLMHVSLLSIVVGHVVGITFVGRQFTYIGASRATSEALSRASGVLFGVLFVVCIVALFYRRITVAEVKKLSDPADYFDLALLLSIAATGLQMRLGENGADLVAVRAYVSSLFALRPSGMPQQWTFVAHFVLINALLLYFPFSKLAHLTGSFVSRALVTPMRQPYRTGVGAGQDANVVP